MRAEEGGRLRVSVYGPGAIGGSLAVRLHRAGADVSVIARGAQAEAIRRNGLRLASGREEWQAAVHCVELGAELPLCDVMIVAVKGPDLPAAAGVLREQLPESTRLVFAMNGIPWWFGGLSAPLLGRLDPDGALRMLQARCKVTAAVVHSSNELTAPGCIVNTTPHRNRVLLGTPDAVSDPVLERLAALLRAGGYDATVVPDIRHEIWRKTLLVAAASPVCALTGASLQEAVNFPASRGLIAAAMREGLALGRRLGFDLADETDAWLDLYRDQPVRPSMLQDFEAGREPEVDSGVLAFADIAAAQGLSTPMLAALAALVDLKRQLLARSPLLPGVPP